MNAAVLTLAPSAGAHLLLAQVLGVYWLHDELAGEQGYGLHYGFAQGMGTGVTLLADERSEHDAPLYVGDWIRLRPIGQRRHSLFDNVTHVRADEAALVDWAAIALERRSVAPAQLFALADTAERPDPAATLLAQRDEKLATKYPAVTAFLDRLQQRRDTDMPSPAPSADAWSECFTNGGW